jgi:hypothetical protein
MKEQNQTRLKKFSLAFCFPLFSTYRKSLKTLELAKSHLKKKKNIIRSKASQCTAAPQQGIAAMRTQRRIALQRHSAAPTRT